MISVSIIGVGRVGGALALSLPPNKYSVDNLFVRPGQDVAQVTGKLSGIPRITDFATVTAISSDLIFISTQDAEITAAATELAPKLQKPAIVVHTSGALASTVLSELSSTGSRTASLHPLVSISTPQVGPERFRGAFFCIEGEDGAIELCEQVVGDLGGKPFSIDTQFKTLYHAAAVTACGHLVALFDAAVEIMQRCGLSQDESKRILLPLVTSTVTNLNSQTTAAALTGTFARADSDTFARHLTALNAHVPENLLEIYLLLGERSLEMAAKQGVNAERIEKLRTKVSIARSKLKW